MNTSAVSKLLGVSSSTVQRWVKHLGLEMKRNEFGHYVYSDEDIEQLKSFREQLHNGIPVQDIVKTTKHRKGSIKIQDKKDKNENVEWKEKIRELESRLNNKADSVVAYQLLQHRSEIEDLQKQLERLNRQLEELQGRQQQVGEDELTEENLEKINQKRKKRTFLTAIFGS